MSTLILGFLWFRASTKSSASSDSGRQYLWMQERHSVTAVPMLVFGSLYFSRMTDTKPLADDCSQSHVCEQCR